jgi:hypothetical protein
LQGFGFDKLVYRTGDPNNDNEKDTTFLNYESLIPLMIKYIQDLNKRIEKLESKNNG